MKTPRTLIIGLDGATFDLITPWVRLGYLPSLAQFIAEGAHGSLQAWPNMNSAAAWSSILTGYNPGQHGVHDFGTAAPRRGIPWQPITAASRAKLPFWHFLNAAGKRVGVINVPISYPVDPANSFMLAGMDSPGMDSPGFAHPPELLDELRQAGIDYVLDVPKLDDLRRENLLHTPDSVRQMIDARARTILHLMQSRTWDTLMAVFIATDRVQHIYWPDEDVPLSDDSWAPIRGVYQQIDSFLNDVLRLVDDNTTVLIISDHGFGPSRPVARVLIQLFEELGLLQFRSGRGGVSSRLLKGALLQGRRILPLSLQETLAKALPQMHLRALNENAYGTVDWSKTQVYADLYGGRMYINLQGREEEGIVPPTEYDLLRERLREVLLDLTDAATGRRVIREVHRREDLYHGPYLQKAADLFIEWDYKVVQETLVYRVGEKTIVIEGPSGPDHYKWPGNHSPMGILVAYGPHIKQGASIADASIYDVAPTILHLQDHPVPRDMDGKVLTDVFVEEQLRLKPVQYADLSTDVAQATESELDTSDYLKIEERLRGLGYLE